MSKEHVYRVHMWKGNRGWYGPWKVSVDRDGRQIDRNSTETRLGARLWAWWRIRSDAKYLNIDESKLEYEVRR